MATRASKQPTAPASQPGQPSLSVPTLAQGPAGPSLGSTPLLLRPGRGPWTWCVSAAKLGVRYGRIVPLVVPAWHTPGLSGNVRGDAGEGYVSQLKRSGFVPIPHSFLPAVAWGRSREGAQHSTYLDRYEGHDIEGRPAVKWVDAWTRPLQLGHHVEWESDKEGRDTFLIAAWRELANGGREPSELQVRLATRPVISRIEQEANNSSERSRLLIRQMVENLPPESITESIRQICQRQGVQVGSGDDPDTE